MTGQGATVRRVCELLFLVPRPNTAFRPVYFLFRREASPVRELILNKYGTNPEIVCSLYECGTNCSGIKNGADTGQMTETARASLVDSTSLFLLPVIAPQELPPPFYIGSALTAVSRRKRRTSSERQTGYIPMFTAM